MVIGLGVKCDHFIGAFDVTRDAESAMLFYNKVIKTLRNLDCRFNCKLAERIKYIRYFY